MLNPKHLFGGPWALNTPWTLPATQQAPGDPLGWRLAQHLLQLQLGCLRPLSGGATGIGGHLILTSVTENPP